jgi:hypothetical protein
MDVQRTEMRGVSGWIRLRWEGQAMHVKMLGTVGTLARFLGKSVRFSSVPKGANGTLAGGQRARVRSRMSEVRSQRSEVRGQ